MLKPQISSSSPMEGPEQINDVADFAAQGWRWRGGTSAQRAGLPSDEVFDGMVWKDTDNGAHLYQRSGGEWGRVLRHSAGVFSGSTSSTGTATVSHGLPSTPVIVLATDKNEGAVPGTRKIVFNASSTTQIQFVVFNGGSPLAENPVVFSWLAYF
jgi:hypothetical protein